MTTIRTNFGEGGQNLAPNASGAPSLADTLRDVADDFSGNVKVPAWTTGVVVTTHVATLPSAGFVFAVHATAGGTPGPKQLIQTGAPGAGQVRVDYTAGVPTLTFATAEAVTACAVQQLPYAAIKTIKA